MYSLQKIQLQLIRLMSITLSYPLPKISPNKDINKFIYNRSLHDNPEWINYYYNRILTKEVNLIKLQYLSIEKDLIDSFLYVLPVTKNITTTSIKFATIIRESANLFEQLSRDVFCKLFECNSNAINIYNFLSLDLYLNFSTIILNCPTISYLTENNNLLSPFKETSAWDKSTPLTASHVPKWWKAYNKVKHSYDGIETVASFENAFRSVAAIYVLIRQIYGPQVLSNNLRRAENFHNQIILAQIPTQGSNLFWEEDGLVGFSY